MEALEWLEKSRVRMINFLACSASQLPILVNSDLYVATENRYFWYHISLTIKPVLEVFEQKEEIIIQLSHLFDHQLICITNKKQTTKNKFLALHFSFTAITRSFQSLKIMKHFNKSVFGTLGTKKPRILRNYSLTSITGNEISEVRNHKKSLPRKF